MQRGIEVYALAAVLQLLRERRFDAPVFHRHESADLTLAVNHEAQRYGLHATGGQPTLYLAPQYRAKSVANQPVQYAACLLGVNQVIVKLTRVLECLIDSFPCDFVEHHALYFGFCDVRRFQQMPRDSLAFAVRVSRQIDHIGILRCLAQLRDYLLLVRHDGVSGMKALIVYFDTVDAFFALCLLVGQVAHMPHRRESLVSASKETPDCAGFCG